MSTRFLSWNHSRSSPGLPLQRSSKIDVRLVSNCHRTLWQDECWNCSSSSNELRGVLHDQIGRLTARWGAATWWLSWPTLLPSVRDESLRVGSWSGRARSRWKQYTATAICPWINYIGNLAADSFLLLRSAARHFILAVLTGNEISPADRKEPRCQNFETRLALSAAQIYKRPSRPKSRNQEQDNERCNQYCPCRFPSCHGNCYTVCLGQSGVNVINSWSCLILARS